MKIIENIFEEHYTFRSTIVRFLGPEFLSIHYGTSNAFKKLYMHTIFLISIFDYNMFNFLCIETEIFYATLDGTYMALFT